MCHECGADFPRWQGQCSACKAWNTVSEVRLAKSPTPSTDRFSGYAGELQTEIQTLDQISLQEDARLESPFKEFDRVLGGGIMQGSAILIGGQPGAGKSTLLLQLMCFGQRLKTLYVTGGSLYNKWRCVRSA